MVYQIYPDYPDNDLIDRDILDDCRSCNPPPRIRDQERDRYLIDSCDCEPTVSFQNLVLVLKLIDRATSSLTYGVSKVSPTIPNEADIRLVVHPSNPRYYRANSSLTLSNNASRSAIPVCPLIIRTQ